VCLCCLCFFVHVRCVCVYVSCVVCVCDVLDLTYVCACSDPVETNPNQVSLFD